MTYNLLPLLDRPAVDREQAALLNLFRINHVCGMCETFGESRQHGGNGGDGCERAFCQFYNIQHHGLSKSYFDLFVDLDEGSFRGVSVKKKGVANSHMLFEVACGSGNGIMELSNIATWWKRGFMGKYTVLDYQDRKYASNLGGLVLENLQRLQDEAAEDLKSRKYAKATGRTLDMESSRFLNVLWNRESPDLLILTFPTSLPKSLTWKYEGESLVGYDKGLKIIRWYGNGRGHILYTPPVSWAIQMTKL